MLNVLVIHNNLPSQFNHLIPYLKRRPDIYPIGIKAKNRSSPMSDHKVLRNMRIEEYTLNNVSLHSDNYLVSLLDHNIIRAELVAQITDEIKKQGYTPDIIVAHTAWGEPMFLKDRFPNAKLILLQEFMYGPNAPDINFDHEYRVDDRIINVSNVRRLVDAHACLDADVIITPIHWQKSLIPDIFKPKVEVVHDGIDTNYMCPNDSASFTLENGKVLTKRDKVITYISRGLEPYRGYHKFVEAIPLIQKLDPEIEIVIVGNDQVYYSPKLDHPTLTYREYYLRPYQNDIDFNKVHFYKNLDQQLLISLIQLTSVHSYYTYPFFSSLTIFEAMSCGGVVLGSSTPPVTEFIEDGINGYLFDFFNVNEFATKAVEIVNADAKLRDQLAVISHNARETIKARLDWDMQIEPIWDRLLKNKLRHISMAIRGHGYMCRFYISAISSRCDLGYPLALYTSCSDSYKSIFLELYISKYASPFINALMPTIISI